MFGIVWLGKPAIKSIFTDSDVLFFTYCKSSSTSRTLWPRPIRRKISSCIVCGLMLIRFTPSASMERSFVGLTESGRPASTVNS